MSTWQTDLIRSIGPDEQPLIPNINEACPMKFIFSIVLVACLAVMGCATTNFATTKTPVTIKEEWIRKELSIWGGTRIFRVGDLEFGYLRNGNNATYTVDPGRKIIRVWYYANRGNAQNLFWQTDLVDLEADLKPSGKYQVRGNYGETLILFTLVDLDTQEVLAKSGETPIVRRP